MLFRSTAKAEIINYHKKPSLISITTEVDKTNNSILLKWNYNPEGVRSMLIYRRLGNEPLTLYKSEKPASNQFVDTNLMPNTIYTYRLRADYIDGGSSPFTKEIEISY